MPKFMVFVHASEDSEAGKWGAPEEFEDMGAFNKPYMDSGAIIECDGLAASSKGVRVNFKEGSEPTITKGPFALENLVTGYWVLQLENFEQALEFAKKVPFKKGSVEVRPVISADEISSWLEEQKKQ